MLLFNEMNIRYQLKRLQTFMDSDNCQATTFALKCGFKLVRKSYEYTVKKEMLIPSKCNIEKEIMTLNDLTEVQFKYLINLQYEDYIINHQKINPLSEDITIENWEKIICEELAKENSYVLIENNSIIAYLLCYKVNNFSIAIGYTGGRCNNIKKYKNFLYKVMTSLFRSYKQVELEIDDCDAGANILSELFSYKPDISWDTYIKDVRM